MLYRRKIKHLKIKHLKSLLLGCLMSFILLGLGSTAVFSQAASPVSNFNTLCRQVNPVTEPGLIAYFAPNTERRIDATDGSKDGPGSGEAVYLTGNPPEQSADGKFIRVWFDSLDPNYKTGWIATQFNGQGTLKMGDTNWRAANCAN